MEEKVLIGLAVIIVLGIGAQWLSWRLKFPSILFLLIAGFIVGPLLGFLNPDELLGETLMPFVSFSVAIILFEGGLTLNIKELREIGKVVFNLISIGVIVTWIIASTAGYFILDLNIKMATLLGAILVVTGPTVIGPLLRHIRPSDKVSDILKWEGIVIDPIGALLAVLVFEAILPGDGYITGGTVMISLGKTIFFGGIVGFAFAWLLILCIRKFWIPDFLQETVTLMMVISAFLIANLAQTESGLFAVTLMGIVMANQKFVTVKHILEFKENLRVLIISVLFIILSARLHLDELKIITDRSMIFIFILIFLARPLSVFLSSINKGLSIREKLFLSWMAPRGIVAASVSSIFALRLSETGVAQSEVLVPITFAVIVGTVAIYGITSAPVARWLKLAQSNAQGVLLLGAHTWALELAKVIKQSGFNVAVIDTNRDNINKARMEGITAYYGSFMSESIMDKLRLDGIGRLLAVTSNDEANSLAVLHFDGIFERENLYQLPFSLENKGELFSPKHLRGRFLFGDEIYYSYIRNRFFHGAIIKSTKLSDEFDYNSFQSHYMNNAVPLFYTTEQKELIIVSSDKVIEPRNGWTIIALIDEPEGKTAINS